MNNHKSTKSALITSVIALLLCFAMLFGTTFAWFTDEVVNTNNIIKTGTLEVGFYYSDENRTANSETGWISLDRADYENDTAYENVKVFNYNNWEPGYTDVKFIKITNEGSLAFKYQLDIIPSKMITKNNLADVIDVYFGIVDGTETINRDNVGDNTVLKYAGTLASLMAETDGAAHGKLLPAKAIAKNADEVVENVTACIALKMKESANNDYQGISVGGDKDNDGTITLQLIATQLTYEDDSFDDQYDKDAFLPENVQFNGDSTTIPDVIDEDKSIALDLNNETLDKGLTNNGTVEIENGKITTDVAGLENYGNATIKDVTMKAGSAKDYSNIAYAGSVTEYNNVDIVSAGGGIGAVNGATVIFNSGSVAVNSESTSGRYVFYTEGAGSTITINGGDFSFSKEFNQKRAYIYAGAGTTVYVKGGTFGPASTRSGYTAGILGSGTVIITGGTFGFDPTTWVADGYEAVKSGNTWTVSAK